MQVDLVLFASLSAYYPEGGGGRMARALDLVEGTTVAELAEMLGLPDQPRVVMINNRHGDESDVLREGDRIAIFPPVAGG